MMTDEIPYSESIGPDGQRLYTPKQWLNRFIQFVERKYAVDLKQLTTDAAMTGQVWADKEDKRCKDFNWAFGPDPLHTMTTLKYDEKHEDMTLKTLWKVFNEFYILKRNLYHNKSDFLWMKQRNRETPQEPWMRLVKIKRECKSQTMEKRDLLICKFKAAQKAEDLRDKILKEKEIEFRTIFELIQQDIYNKNKRKIQTVGKSTN